MAQRVFEMMQLLLDILHAPDPSTLATFLGRIPMVFNVDASNEITAELQGVPDLIIGNYNDGNLCNIAHALEKTKYLDSDIYWRKYEDKYHLACQFTTDLISMNNADFIITSIDQEITG
ncbi:hypothetical protein Goari_003084, partial [Gossypium aridum]|nr:hypothetical protein [Gossypium aridum]